MLREVSDSLSELAGEGVNAFELLCSALDGVRIGAAILKPLQASGDFVHVYANHEFLQFKPFLPMVGKPYSEVWPELAPRTMPRLAEVLETGESWIGRDEPFDIQDAAGAVTTRHFSFDVERLEVDDAHFLLLTSMETTATVEAQSRLAETLAILDAVPIPITYLDGDLIYRQCNRAAAAALGRPCDEIVGRTLAEVAGEESDVTRAVRGVVESGESFSEMLEFEPPGQPDLKGYYIVSYVADKDATGKVKGVFAEGFDVSEQMQRLRAAEQERESLLVRLQQESVQLQKALAEATLLSEVVQRSSQPFAYGRPDGSLILVNRAFEELTGYSADELIGMASAWSEVLTPSEWREPEERVLKELHRTGEPQRYEKEYERKDGSRATVDILVHLLRDETGGEEAYYAFITDVTERRRLEAEVEESRARLAELLARVTDGMFALDTDWRFTFVTPPIQQFAGGLPAEEMLGRSVWEVFPGLEGSAFGWAYRQAMAEQQPVHLRDYYEPLDRWFDARAYPSSSGVSVFFLDVTDAAQAEQHLEDERLRLKTLVDTLPAAVFISDAAGRIIYTNQQAIDIWGGIAPVDSADEYGIYKGWWPETGERLRSEDWSGVRALRGETVLGEVIDIERFDGVRATILNSSAPIRDREGRITGQVTVELDITERSRLEREAAESRERLTRELQSTRVLKDTAAASLVLDAEELAHRALETLQESIKLRAGIVYLLDERRGLLQNLAIVGYEPEVRRLFDQVPLDEQSVSGRSVLRDELLVFNYGSLPPATRARADAAGEGESTWVVVPVHSAQQAIGNITLVFDPERAISESDLSLFRALADQLGIAITNARLYEREREVARLGEVLALIDQGTHSSLQVDEVVSAALREGALAIGAESAAIDGTEAGRWVVWYDWGFEPSIVGHEYTDEQNPHGVAAARSGQTIAIDDAFNDHRVHRETMQAYGLNAAIVAPLIVRGEAIAALYYNYHSGPHRFSEAEIDFVERVASSLSLAIENARLFTAEAERARLGRSMVEMSAQLASSLDVDEVLPGVLTRLCEEIGAMGASVTDRVDNGWRVRHITGLEHSGIAAGYVFADEDAPSSMHVLKTREPFTMSDLCESTAHNREVAERSAYRAYSIHPLVVRGEVTGALTVFFEQPRSLGDIELDFVRRAAFSISLAEESSRLYATEHRIAETLQTALLALPEQLPGLEIAHEYRSATEIARVGGDFYDLFEIEHDTVGIIVGDIAGHGVEAATLTSLIKNAIRVQAMQAGATPDEVVAVVSRFLFQNSPPELFATVFFGVLDLGSGRLDYCNAGHTTAAIAHSGGGVEVLPANSPLIGAVPELDFSAASTTLSADALLLLYTDGLTEARRPAGELFGEERVIRLFAEVGPASPGDVVRRLVDEALQFAGGQLADDLALLAIRRDGVALVR